MQLELFSKIFIKPFLLLIILLCFYSYVSSQSFTKEKAYIEYLLQNTDKTDFIEGIWKVKHRLTGGIKDGNGKIVEMPMNVQTEYRMAIIKSYDTYFSYKCDDFFPDNIYENKDAECASFGFEKTAIEGQYLFELSGCSMFKNGNGKAFIKSDGDLEFRYKQEETINGQTYFETFSITATKVAPTQSDIQNRKNKGDEELKKNLKPKYSYGSGTAVSDYLIMTCYHIVENAKEISVRGINGRFDTTYSASIHFFDPSLDLAILKVDNFQSNVNFHLPFSFKPTKSEVGENVFVLGYPLQNTMGQEIKLTTGVISSNSGFLGDTTLFLRRFQ